MKETKTERDRARVSLMGYDLDSDLSQLLVSLSAATTPPPTALHSCSVIIDLGRAAHPPTQLRSAPGPRHVVGGRRKGAVGFLGPGWLH